MYLENSILDIYSVVNFNNRVEDTLYRVSTPTDSGRVDFPHPAIRLLALCLSFCFINAMVYLGFL